MRRGMFLLATAAVALFVASGVALAQVVNCPTGAGGLCVGTNGNDTLNGTNGVDDMRGLKGNDRLIAGPENDTLLGGRGNDALNGEADNDLLNGVLGNDTLLGGPGDDTYQFANGWGKDRIGDDAFDVSGERLTFTLVSTPIKMDLISSSNRPEVQSGANTLNFGPNVVVVEIDGSSSNDDIAGTDGGEGLNGIGGNDKIRGRAGADTLMGLDGNDNLFGGSGEDNFDAGKGSDVLNAVDGEKDVLVCGPGKDTAFFDQGLDDLQGCEVQRPQ